jgi:glutaminyl-peptide cyclotransferase
MRSALGVILAITLIICSCGLSPSSSPQPQASISGEKALEHVRAQVAFGPRPPGSSQLQKCREYIIQQMRGFGYQVEDDSFIAQTPPGAIRMHNLIAQKGSGGKGVIAFATHYDTKLMKGQNFVGANDGGSSTGLVLELARVLAENKDQLDYWFLFLDGEEAFVQWSESDSTYGSRHLAHRWRDDKTASKIHALILLDMIGDKELNIWYETNSSKRLMDLAWNTATKIGLESMLSRTQGAISDDHIPFLEVGIPSIDIIDFSYGPGNSYWHTPQDTLDKISAQSLENVGKLVLSMLSELQK